MTDAFAKIYNRYPSAWSKAWRPAFAPRTYLRALHLLVMFPLGIAYFVALVTALSVGGAMIWTIVGPLVLIPTLFLTRWAGDGEAWAVRRVAQIELRRPPTAIERGQSARSQVWTRIIDPSTWTGLVYLFGSSPSASLPSSSSLRSTPAWPVRQRTDCHRSGQPNLICGASSIRPGRDSRSFRLAFCSSS